MNRYLFLSIFFFCSVSCKDKKPLQAVETSKNADTIISKKSSDNKIKLNEEDIYPNDSAVVFGDNDYKLLLHTFYKASSDQTTKNALLIFSKNNGEKIDTLFRDSLYCMHPTISFKDFNNDKIKDVLVFNYTGGRANPTYHLYLTNPNIRRLIRVKGFEELPNPDLDTANNIITSLALSGTNYWSFYTINHENKLINLGHEYEATEGDSVKWKRALKQILKQRRKSI